MITKNMIVRNEINWSLVHIDVIWYTCVFCQKEMGSAIGLILLYACFFITACVLLYTATFRMIRHMLACFKRFFCFDHFLTIHAYIYIYLPILPSTCTNNMYINANHKLVYHFVTYFAILHSATRTVYGLQYVRS